MKDLMLLFFGFIFFTSVIFSQDDKIFDWFPDPGPLPSFLSNMAGEWKVTFSGFEDSSEYHEFTGTWEVVLGGRCLMGKFSGPDSWESIAITGYNNWAKTYFFSTFSNKIGAPEHLEGVYNDSSQTISYTYYTFFKGAEAISYMIFTDPDNIIWEFLSPQGEKEGEVRFTRIK